MAKIAFRFALFAALTLGLSACPRAEDEHKLTITGSSTVAPVMAEIAKKFEAEHPGVRVDVQTGGSSRGIQDAVSGLADIGMASRSLKGDEVDQLHVHTIARDGVGIIVHKDNPLRELTAEQVVGVYLDRINDWSDLGGSPGPITVVNKAEGRATLEVFLDYFDLDNTDIQADVVVGDNEQGIKSVVGNPRAIGYVSIGTAQYDIEKGVDLALVKVGDVEPTFDNLRNGTYPISRPLNLLTREEPTGLTKELIDYVHSDAATEIIEHQYFVQVSP